MDELKLLVQMVKDLPSMALWVIAFFFIYKVTIIGSIYGVIRLAIERAYGVLIRQKHETVDIVPTLRGMVIDGNLDELIGQLLRLRGKAVGIDSQYLHKQSVEWLRQAIDAKEAEDAAKAASKAKAA